MNIPRINKRQARRQKIARAAGAAMLTIMLIITYCLEARASQLFGDMTMPAPRPDCEE